MRISIAFSLLAFSVILLLAFTGRNQQSSDKPSDALIESSIDKLHDSISMEKTRLHEPVLYGVEAIHGLTMDNSVEKIDLAPAQTKTAPFIISTTDLAFVGSDLKWVNEKGEFLVSVENSNKNLLSGEKNVNKYI